MTRRVFVSDVHMSPGWSLGGDKKYFYDWCRTEDAANFEGFLNYLAGSAQYDEVILLGDIMDTWIYPVGGDKNNGLPSFGDIAAAKASVINALNDLVTEYSKQKKRVVYVRGNHDMTITNGEILTIFPGMAILDPYDSGDGIRAEHGHQYTMWNAKDTRNNVPVGYYLSRLYATTHAKGNQDYRLPDIQKAVFSPNDPQYGLVGNWFVNKPLTCLADDAGVTEDGTIVMPTNANTTLKEARGLYTHLIPDWETDYGDADVLRSVERELGKDLSDAARSISWNEKKQVVVFGHTHLDTLQVLAPPGRQPPPPRGPVDDLRYGIYANCGGWCQDNPPVSNSYTFVVTESDNGHHKVSLMHWEGAGKEPTLKQEPETI